jgi:hypothetical protein
MNRPSEKLFEVIRRKVHMIAPVEPQPEHVAFDRFDISGFFLGRIGVVEAQVTAPTKFARDSKIQANRLGVTDVKVAVGFGGKPRDNSGVPPSRQIAAQDLANKVVSFGGIGFGGTSHGKHQRLRRPGADPPADSAQRRMEGDRGFEPRTR